MIKRYEIDYGGRNLIIETGKAAKQAHGSCVIRYGDTVVLVTACRQDEPRLGVDFMPLTVNYLEMTYAAGKIPGGFFKREGRPSEREVLCSRLIDRPLRPLFKEGYKRETQVLATVMSLDGENDPEIIAIIGASIALGISDIPFLTPIAAVRVGRIDDRFIINPSLAQQKESDIDLVVAGAETGIIMVEGGARFVSEDSLVSALTFAEESIKGIIKLQHTIIKECGKEKIIVEEPAKDGALKKRVEDISRDKLNSALNTAQKIERYRLLDEAKAELLAVLSPDYTDREHEITEMFNDLKYELMREKILSEDRRVDGRTSKDIREIDCEVGLLPRTHGSALFTRGETQAMVVTTLGTSDDEQKIDALLGWEYKTFMLHYNFPPSSTGEVKVLRGPGRREIGHGALAERAVAKVLPPNGKFPYTIRVVSDILESNGSSSMATVCGASLSLMDAGVPIRCHVAGIAMGLIKEGDRYAILSDILGDEDHLGDMDFKVAGTAEGVTALQMDIKIGGVTQSIMHNALHQARAGRLHILKKMEEAITEGRVELSLYAPRITTLTINLGRIKDLIGPGGKNIKNIIQVTGVKINVEDDGRVNIASANAEAVKKAIEMVKSLTEDVEIGKLYLGRVRKIMEFGAFVEVLPGIDGLVHISQLSNERVKSVRDVLKEGDEVLVKVLDVDKDGKIKLSRKDALGETLPQSS